MRVSKPLVLLGLSLVLGAACDPTASVSTTNGITVDSQSLNAADIPQATLDAIRELDIYFEHASVGGNISDGIDALAAENSSRYSIGRATWGESVDPADNLDWFDSNNGFVDFGRGNPGFAAKVSGFEDNIQTGGVGSRVDVASYKMCYIDYNFSGYDNDIPVAFAAARDSMEALEAAYPSVAFVWWTMPIETIGDADRDAYNTLVRQYCSANNKWLLDIADIEAHDGAGTHLTDSNGYEYMYADWTDDGGHLDTDGARRLALAWWVLLARISGWD